MIYFDDSVTADNLPLTQEYAVYYTDGRYANEVAVRARLPKAKLYGITPSGQTGKNIFACDCETEDLTTTQAENWVAEQIKLGSNLVCVYANLSTWDSGLEAALAKYGNRIKRWVAAYDGVAEVPTGFDAKQYMGGITVRVDNNVANDDFFSPYKPPIVDPYHYLWFDNAKITLSNNIQTSERESVQHYDEQRPHPLTNGINIIKIQDNLLLLAQRLETIMKNDNDPKGLKFHRAWRHSQLLTRSQGNQVVYAK